MCIQEKNYFIIAIKKNNLSLVLQCAMQYTKHHQNKNIIENVGNSYNQNILFESITTS